MQEFFYTQVPSSMKTIGIGLNTSVFGFRSFLGAFLITALEMVMGKTAVAVGGSPIILGRRAWTSTTGS
jgi:solute carrier family 15 (peptide/histidine transporter), member 3/4